MQGISGTFAFNGNIVQMPTEHFWIDPQLLGTSGNGNPTYPSVRQYEMKWNLMSMSDYSALHDAYNACMATGTVVADLPKFRTNPYQFYSYSGCTLREPTGKNYFQEYVEDVILVVTRVRV